MNAMLLALVGFCAVSPAPLASALQRTPPATPVAPAVRATPEERFLAALVEELVDLRALARLGRDRSDSSEVQTLSDLVGEDAFVFTHRLEVYAQQRRIDLERLRRTIEKYERVRTAQLPSLIEDLKSVGDPRAFNLAYLTALDSAIEGTATIVDTGKDLVRDPDLLTLTEALAGELAGDRKATAAQLARYRRPPRP